MRFLCRFSVWIPSGTTASVHWYCQLFYFFFLCLYAHRILLETVIPRAIISIMIIISESSRCIIDISIFAKALDKNSKKKKLYQKFTRKRDFVATRLCHFKTDGCKETQNIHGIFLLYLLGENIYLFFFSILSYLQQTYEFWGI